MACYISRTYEEGRLTFLYVTPERLKSRSFQKIMKNASVSLIVVDECHCATEWGNTFRDAYLKIGAFIDMLPDRPAVCACSATLPDDRLSEIITLLQESRQAIQAGRGVHEAELFRHGDIYQQ